MLTKVEGSSTTHRWGLNTQHVHEIEDDQLGWDVGGKGIVWDLGLPARGYCWVLSGITVGFSDDPQFPATLWIDADGGSDTYWVSYIGHLPPPIAVSRTLGPYQFEFSPAIKFPADQDVAINWFGGDPLVLFFICWECWQEQESCNGT